MKSTKNLPTRPTLSGLVLALAVTALSSYVARAVPYASGVSNTTGTTWTFVLNEPATAVTVLRNGANPVSITPTKGIKSFDMSGFSTFSIHVTNNVPVAWTLISDDTNPYNEYANPRGLTVSKVSSNLSTFGRIYVSDSVSGSVVSNIVTTLKRTNWGKGIYILNADQSEALGQTVVSDGAGIAVQAYSNGITWGTPLSTASPFRIGFGPDNKLYVNAFGTVDATTWRSTNADCQGFELVLSGVGEYVNPLVHTDASSTPIVTGSTADSSLTMWLLDGARTNSSGGIEYNRIARWDIGGTALPYNAEPTIVGTATAYSSVKDVGCDLVMGLDGKWFVSVNRSAGTDRASIQQYEADATTLLFDSLTFYGSPDPLRNTIAADLSPDGKTYAWITLTNKINMFSLNASGVIDPVH